MNQTGIAHILIVEDETVLREVYQKILTMQGFHVSTARNGIQAFDQIRKQVPDVILLDILMPEMDGREFMRNLDIDAYPELKIIVTSNIADQEIIDEMIVLGAHHHILKSSMTPNSLVDEIQKVIA